MLYGDAHGEQHGGYPDVLGAHALITRMRAMSALDTRALRRSVSDADRSAGERLN
jgi:hypothetical protein